MSAKIESNTFGSWNGYCQDCEEAISGGMAAVYVWAEVHNHAHHGGAA